MNTTTETATQGLQSFAGTVTQALQSVVGTATQAVEPVTESARELLAKFALPICRVYNPCYASDPCDLVPNICPGVCRSGGTYLGGYVEHASPQCV
nr:hypothetical protein [Endozoicomonas sp.]